MIILKALQQIFYKLWFGNVNICVNLCTSSRHSSRRQWHPTPVLVPGKSHGQRSLVGCSPWDRWGSLRVGHDWATSLSLFTFTHWRRKWQPTPVFLPGEFQGLEAWLAAVYGVTQSQTRLKPHSSSSSITIFISVSTTSAQIHINVDISKP